MFFVLGFGAIQYCIYNTLKRNLVWSEKKKIKSSRGAGRYGEAPRKHLIFSVTISDTVQVYRTVYTLLYIQYCKKFSLDFQKAINVHAARDGTAARRYGGAPREHLLF